jgi:hypothetical protein
LEEFSKEEPIPLKSCLQSVNKKRARAKSLSWVLQTVKEVCHIVGISFAGFEEEFMALFMAIDASHSQKQPASYSNFVNK